MPATCKLKRTCSQLRTLLRRLDVDEAVVAQTCDGTKPCPSAFDNALLVTQHLNIDNASLVTSFLKKQHGGTLPIDDTITTAKQIFDKRPFACPELGVEIRQPCSVESCSYWTNHQWTRNCILHYRVDQGRIGLDVKELSFLFHQTIPELRKHLNGVLAEMRRWALLGKTSQVDAEALPEAAPLDSCVVCANVLQKGAILKHGFQYCGRACFDKRPPVDLRIEQEFQLPVQRVVQICIDSFASRRPMCHALDCTTKQLDDLCTRHAIDNFLS